MADWVMVFITFVYVIATIFMCFFSYKSTQITAAQLQEAMRQFEIDLEMKKCPYLEISQIKKSNKRKIRGNGYVWLNSRATDKILKLDVIFRIRNIGESVAKCIAYKWENSYLCDNGGTIYYLPVGDKRDFKVTVMAFFDDAIKENVLYRADMYIKMKDVFNNEYKQIAELRFRVNKKKIVMESYFVCPPMKIESKN